MSSHKYSMYLYNESCFFAEALWRLGLYGQSSMTTHVYYVTAVSDDNNYVKRLMHVLDSDSDKAHTTLIIVLMDSVSQKIVKANSRMLGYEVFIINQGPPFSRSIGLKVGFQYAVNLATERQQTNAIGFSVDTSIIVPNDFSSRIRSNTICGVTAFVPIVYKCMSCLSGNLSDHSDGYWVNTGFGMVGLCLTDYLAIRGWSTVYGYRWGGEDVDIMERINAHLPYVIRTQEPDYIYVRNPSTKEKNPSYYMKKNLFPRPLPPSPLTVPIQDEDLKQRLLRYLKNQVPEICNTEMHIYRVTRTYSDDSHTSNYQILLQYAQNPNIFWFYIHSSLSPLI